MVPVVLAARGTPVVRDGVVLDQTYRTASVTATAPLLLALAVAAVPGLLLLRDRRALRVLGVPLLGAAVVPGGILAYGYVANRYTSEFVPLLVVGSVLALWTVLPPLLRGPRRRGAVVLGVLAAVTAWSTAVQAVSGLWSSAIVGRGEPLVRLLSVQHRVDEALGLAGPPVLRDVTDLPDDAAADTLAATPGCDALYLATGDRYEPWVLVESAPTVLRVTVHGTSAPDASSSRPTPARSSARSTSRRGPTTRCGSSSTTARPRAPDGGTGSTPRPRRPSGSAPTPTSRSSRSPRRPAAGRGLPQPAPR